MFANDTKIWSPISKLDDSVMLQKGFNSLVKWSQTWLLSFNAEKCKVMRIGHEIPTEYNITNQQNIYKLHETVEEKDLRVFTNRDLKPELHCSKSASKAMSVMCLIRRNINRIDVKDFNPLYEYKYKQIQMLHFYYFTPIANYITVNQ